MKTYVYIDGFNLYYGCLKGTRYRWLNPKIMVQKILQSHHEVERIKYFTARISALPHKPDGPKRQEAYLRALRSLPEVEIIYGHFLTNPAMRPRADGSGWVKIRRTEEKGSDVNLATHLVADAFKGAFEAGIVVSNDSDLCEPVRIVTEEVGLMVGILVPLAREGRRRSATLCSKATFWRPIRTGVVRDSQFPDTVATESGDVHRPDRWK